MDKLFCSVIFVAYIFVAYMILIYFMYYYLFFISCIPKLPQPCYLSATRKNNMSYFQQGLITYGT